MACRNTALRAGEITPSDPLRYEGRVRSIHTDEHAMLLHLFGLDPERLVSIQNGRKQSLSDNPPCRVVTEILV